MQTLPKDKRGPQQLAGQFMELIAKLHHAESEARHEGLDAEALSLWRRERSVPILKQIEALVLAKLHAVALGKALHYAQVRISAHRGQHIRLMVDGISARSWTAFQSDRERCFSVIVDDGGGAQVIF